MWKIRKNSKMNFTISRHIRCSCAILPFTYVWYVYYTWIADRNYSMLIHIHIFKYVYIRLCFWAICPSFCLPVKFMAVNRYDCPANGSYTVTLDIMDDSDKEWRKRTHLLYKNMHWTKWLMAIWYSNGRI